ncbi:MULTISPECIES: hypothetical protein [Fischerella]|uniref:Uncharacterized protein n=1 Tax=Fischerella muscicola CCMEE 5323 TaxID=2019572 RepID=A0A2N6K601_FISMU|nr:MULTISPECIES: hypothetical protein [Fischerella]MBD2433791.1 hypothetical protein [Fischerella sp. FACHB-380]PLZ92184.1 hypothetical protein CEN44_06660 [Fischerella muscicola CCMEE 5323]
MLAQLQSLYPTASLISELVQIDHGKYIVRASVQIEGITRATGMAAAPTVEEAEDQARSRALMVLGITTTPQVQMESLSEAKSVTEAKTTRSSDAAKTEENVPAPPPLRVSVSAFTPSPIDTPNLETQPSTPIPPTVSATPTIDTYSQDFEPSLAVSASPELPLDIQPEDFGVISNSQSENQPLPEISSSNVTPFPQRSHNNTPTEAVAAPAPTARKKKKSEPVDQSDDIAKIGVEMQRLGWTTEQGRDYLIQTYGKRSRHLLDSEELRDFLKYLESQPTPIDPLAGF